MGLRRSATYVIEDFGSKLMATDHYIPQSLLRRFVEHTQGRNLSVLDKISGKIFHPAVKDFGIEDFHTFSLDMRTEFADDNLPKVETLINENFEDPVAPLFERVVSNSSLIGLTPEERRLIIRFVALQWVRVPGRVFDMRSAMSRTFETVEPARNLRVYGTPNKPDQSRDLALMGFHQC